MPRRPTSGLDVPVPRQRIAATLLLSDSLREIKVQQHTAHVLYDEIGIGYSRYRRPDDRIARQIDAALGESKSVVNVGAGTGSYEPQNRWVIAVEPSAEMIRQRPEAAAHAIQATADRLPFPDHSFDAALAVLTLHHWPNREQGLAELVRVARNRIVIVTWDPDHSSFWLMQDYFPEILEIDRTVFPTLNAIESIAGPIDVEPILIPGDCADGFLGAYWRRPEAYLDAGVRSAISAFAKLQHTEPALMRLRSDLADGTWRRRYGFLLERSALDIGYRLVTARSPHACHAHSA